MCNIHSPSKFIIYKITFTLQFECIKSNYREICNIYMLHMHQFHSLLTHLLSWVSLVRRLLKWFSYVSIGGVNLNFLHFNFLLLVLFTFLINLVYPSHRETRRCKRWSNSTYIYIYIYRKKVKKKKKIRK